MVRQCVLLTNGEVLQGTVQFDGLKYTVTLDTGAVQLAPSNVQHVAASMSALYALKARNVLLTDVDGRVALIRWCIDNALYTEARRETQRLAQVSPNHPMIEVFYRNIEAMQSLQTTSSSPAQTAQAPGMVGQAPNTQGQTLGMAPQVPGTVGQSLSTAPQVPGMTTAGNAPQVGMAVPNTTNSPMPASMPSMGTETSMGPPSTTVPTSENAALDGPSVAELERMAASLSPDAITIFRKQIQPILSKSCMDVGCHGAGSQEEFRLLRVSSKTSRNTLLRNIFAAIQQIDLNVPEASPLLRKPVAPHGNGRVVFSNRDYATYQLLIAWTYLVAENRYVISRDYLLPPTRQAPVFISTPHGPEKISKHDLPKAGTVVVPMAGVSPSLLPQALYPQDYIRNTTPLQPRKQVRLNTTPASKASGTKESATDVSDDTPPSYEAPVGRSIGGNAEETAEETPAAGNSTVETPSTENSEDDSETTDKSSERVYTDAEIRQMEKELKGAEIRPAEIHQPGRSSGNVRTGQPQVVAAPGAQFTPMSPVELLMSAPEGVQNHESADGAYYYNPDEANAADQAANADNSGSNSGTSSKRRKRSNSNGTIVWQQMLEMQKALEAEGQMP